MEEPEMRRDICGQRPQFVVTSGRPLDEFDLPTTVGVRHNVVYRTMPHWALPALSNCVQRHFVSA
jgi:hypothetical protein